MNTRRGDNKFFHWILIAVFSFSSFSIPSEVSAQNIASAIGSSYQPSLIRGVTIYPDRPLEMDFIISQGDEAAGSNELYQQQAQQMIRDFMSAMTLPEKDLWVNLSPYEKDRVIPDSLGATDMGREFLVLDYELKKLTASLMSPESESGKMFWERVYAAARAQGTNDIPAELFHKVWIAPEKAVVFQRGQSIFIADSHLKVMLEEDYLAQNVNASGQTKGISAEAKNILHQTIIPVIEQEVNEGRTFARLRQIYHSIIMAKWYKQHLKQSLLGQVYADQSKVNGLESGDPQARQRVYEQYLQVFKQGSSQIQEEYDPSTQQIVAKNYFSGGLVFEINKASLVQGDDSVVEQFLADTAERNVGSWPVAFQDAAMLKTESVVSSVAVDAPFVLDISDLTDDLPVHVDFMKSKAHDTLRNFLDFENVKTSWTNLSKESRVFFALAYLQNKNVHPLIRREVAVLNAIAYFRQLAPQDQRQVLDDIAQEFEAYELAGWLKSHNNLPLDQLAENISRRFDVSIQPQTIEYIRFQDRVITTARSARIGMEVVTKDEKDVQSITQALSLVSENPEISDVVFGLRSASVVSLDEDQVVQLRRVLRGLRIVEGNTVNIVHLGRGEYYIYDEDRLRKETISDVIKSMKKGKAQVAFTSLSSWLQQRFKRVWTQEGLEHLIRTDMSLKRGLFFDMQRQDQKIVRSERARAIASAVMLGHGNQRLMYWDQKLEIWRATKSDEGKFLAKRIFQIEPSAVETSWQATMNRLKLFPKSMRAEAESQVIFNYQSPIGVIDDSDEEIRLKNIEVMEEIAREYGVTFYHMDKKHFDWELDHYTHVLATSFEAQLRQVGSTTLIHKLLQELGVLKDGGVDKVKLRELLKRTVFLHISGVRNRQFLVAKGEGASLNFDDDAPPYAIAVIEKVWNAFRGKRLAKREYQIRRMLRDVEKTLGLNPRSLKSEDDFYALPEEKLMRADVQAILDKYFEYNPDDSQKGLIPEAMEQIRSLKNEYYRPTTFWGKLLKVTDQRYFYWMNSKKRSLAMADMVHRENNQTEEDIFPVNYSNHARYLGKKVGETDLPVMVNTLRGLLASNASPDEIIAQLDRVINMMTFDFNRDTDTGGAVQAVNYLLSEDKLRLFLQTTGQKKLLVDGGRGFTGPDNWPVFNRLVMRNLFVFASLMGPLRGEEPLMGILSINPVTRDTLIVASGKVVGGQIREFSQRLYVIANQDITEMIGAAAKAGYMGAVEEFEKLMASRPDLQGDELVYERYRILGEIFIKHGVKFEVLARNKNFLKKQQMIRAQMMAELGIQIGERAKMLADAQARLLGIEKAGVQLIPYLWKKYQHSPRVLNVLRSVCRLFAGTKYERIKILRQEVMDMEMVLMQYASAFKLYTAKKAAEDYTKKEAVSYAPADQDKDYLYRVTRRGEMLEFQAVYPDIAVSEENNQYNAVDNHWKDIPGKLFLVKASDFKASKPLKVEEGRFVIMPRLPEGVEAIVPYVSQERHQQLYDHTQAEIRRQIKADGQTMQFWPELVKAAIPWRELGFLKRDNVADLELDAKRLKELSGRIVDEINRAFDPDKVSSLRMLDTHIEMSPEDVDQVASIGLIEGTGMNTSMQDPLTGKIYNEESGAFDRLEGITTEEDRIIIKNFKPEHGQVFEKMVSGKYIGERVRQYLLSYHNASKFLPNQNYVPFLYQSETFSAELMTDIEKVETPEDIIRFLKADVKLGLADVEISDEDALRVKEVIRAVYRQAARLLAAKIAADIQWIDARDQQKTPGVMKRQHMVLAEGSVIQNAPYMMGEINEALFDILGEQDAGRIHISLEGSIATGGVVSALIAQNKKEGQVIVVDTGGSNSRVYLAEIQAGQQEAQIIQENEVIKFDRTDLRDVSFREFVRRTIVQQIKDLNLPADQTHVVSWTFAFPVGQDGLKKGKLIALTKGFQWHDAIGQDPVAILEEVLREERINNIQVVILLNDTPRRQLALKPDFSKMEFRKTGANGDGAVDKGSLADNGGLDMTRFDLDVRADNAMFSSVPVEIPEELRNVTGFVPVFKGYQPVDLPALLKK